MGYYGGAPCEIKLTGATGDVPKSRTTGILIRKMRDHELEGVKMVTYQSVRHAG